MLYILQYLSIFAAFMLPWAVGGTVRFAKNGDRKKLILCVSLLAIDLIVLGITVSLAFGINK